MILFCHQPALGQGTVSSLSRSLLWISGGNSRNLLPCTNLPNRDARVACHGECSPAVCPRLFAWSESKNGLKNIPIAGPPSSTNPTTLIRFRNSILFADKVMSIVAMSLSEAYLLITIEVHIPNPRPSDMASGREKTELKSLGTRSMVLTGSTRNKEF
jgi:hypothetical protein